jgi:hypothetical protein
MGNKLRVTIGVVVVIAAFVIGHLTEVGNIFAQKISAPVNCVETK